MTRILPIDPSSAQGKAKELLDAVQSNLGLTPNMMRTMAQSPAVLDAYLAFSGSLSRGVLGGKVREQIALATGEANACDYCLSAHSAIGGKLGLSPQDVERARTGSAEDPKAGAALKLAQALVRDRGRVSDEDLSRARAAGLGDAEIAEVVANVALNLFTNYFNHVAQPPIDFPPVYARPVA